MKKTIVLALATFASLGLHAEQGKTYWGVEFGAANLENHSKQLETRLVSTLNVPASVTNDSNVPTIKFFAGYHYSENLDLELGYFKRSSANINFSGVHDGSIAYTGIGNIKSSGFEYAVNIRPSIASGWNDLYFRIGGHSSKLDINGYFYVDNTFVSSGGKSNSGTGALYGFGYDHKLNQMTKVRFSAVSYSSIGGEAGFDDSVYSIGIIKKFD
jgi:hypothetical protein